MGKRVAHKGKTRFTMWIDADMLEQIEKLKSVTGKASVADVFRDAVAVYGSLVTANRQGVRFSYENRKTGETGHVWLVPGPPPFDEA